MFNTDNHIKKVCILLMNNLFLLICVLVGFHIDAYAKTYSVPTVTFSENFSTDKWITEPFTFFVSGSDLYCEGDTGYKDWYYNNVCVRYWFNQELEASQGQNARTQGGGSRGEIFTCSGYQGQQGVLTLYAQVYCAVHEDDYSEIYRVTFKYDDQPPIVNGKLINGVIYINATDYTSGVQYYGISKSKEVYPTKWTTSNKFTPSEYGSYYLFAKDAAGNIGVSKETVNSVTPINNYPVNITGTYSYTGKAIKPNIAVCDINNPGYNLIEGQDYTVSLFNNVNAGTATVTIKGIGNYTGSVTKTFKIEKAEQELINNTSRIKMGVLYQDDKGNKIDDFKLKVGDGKISYISSNRKIFTIDQNGRFSIKNSGIVYLTITASETSNFKETKWRCKIEITPTYVNFIKVSSKKKGQMTIKWGACLGYKKLTGYKIQISTNKNFTKKTTKTYTVKGKKDSFSKTIKGLKKGKKYYVRVRSYTTNSEGTLYGDYSGRKTVKVKK